MVPSHARSARGGRTSRMTCTPIPRRSRGATEPCDSVAGPPRHSRSVALDESSARSVFTSAISTSSTTRWSAFCARSSPISPLLSTRSTGRPRDLSPCARWRWDSLASRRSSTPRRWRPPSGRWAMVASRTRTTPAAACWAIPARNSSQTHVASSSSDAMPSSTLTGRSSGCARNIGCASMRRSCTSARDMCATCW